MGSLMNLILELDEFMEKGDGENSCIWLTEKRWKSKFSQKL